MRRRAFGFLIATLGLFAVTAPVPPAAAHHSPVAYDGSEVVAVQGVLTEIRWGNPHTWFHVDATDSRGKVTSWRFQGEGPAWLARHGVAFGLLKVGDRVTIRGFHAKHTSQNLAAGREIVLADGRSFTVGPPIAN